MTRKLSVTESRKLPPVLGDFVAQEIERGVRELSTCGLAFVVRYIPVHEAAYLSHASFARKGGSEQARAEQAERDAINQGIAF